MTTLEYMKKQHAKHQKNYEREAARGVPQKMLDDIKAKENYYKEAVEALEKMGV